jgi:Bacteriophage head-tail adaptor
MSFGKMREIIEVVKVEHIKDKDGFKAPQDIVVARAKAYKETKHGNERWANLSVFSTATVLFRLRKIPNIDITTEMVIFHKGSRYQITSVEDVREKGMYLEILAEKMEGSKSG